MKIFGFEIRRAENETFVLFNGKIRRWDLVLANEEDYPHWKNHPQIVTRLLDNGEMEVDNFIRVNQKSYKKIFLVFCNES